MSNVIPSTTPLRTFESHESSIMAVAVFPDKRRMVTGSNDGTLLLRDQLIDAHSSCINSVDFNPDGTVLATGSWDNTVKFWCTKTWQMQEEPIKCTGDVYSEVYCVRYSPSGELLAIATERNIQIYNPGTRKRVTSFNLRRWSYSLAWTLDGTRLLSASGSWDSTIHEWDPLTWQQVGHPCEGHTRSIKAIAIHPAGILVASASEDNCVRLWRLSDRRTIRIFQHSSTPTCVTFSANGRHILSGGDDNKISEWAVPTESFHPKILAITTSRDACLTGDLATAEELLTQDIHTGPDDYTSYAHRSFVMARKHNWALALEDAIKSIGIQSSPTGYISKGIALCGQGCVWEARIAFDAASMFTNQDSNTNHFLLLIKAIALFNADQHEEAMLLVKELAAACPNTDLLGCRVVETYLRLQLGINAFDGALYDQAADHFTAAVNCSTFSSQLIHQTYEDLTVLFGWDLESLLLTAHQKRCQAFLSAGKPDEALEAHKYMMDALDGSTKISCLDWSNEFKEQCGALVHDLGVCTFDQDGYDAEPNFFRGMPQISRPRPQQRRPGGLERIRLALTRSPRPTPAPPTTPPPAAVATIFKFYLRHLFTRPPHDAIPPAVDVSFAQGRQRNAAAGAPGSEHSLIRDEDYHGPPSPDPNTQQPGAVQVDPGEHGGGRSCC